MVDARDLKSLDPKGLYGFDSRPRHQIFYRWQKTFSVSSISITVNSLKKAVMMNAFSTSMLKTRCFVRRIK